MTIGNNFQSVYITLGKSTVRRKVFVDLPFGLNKPCDIDKAVHDATAEMYGHGVIDDGSFPVQVNLFVGLEDASPIAVRTVDMEIRPQFTVYQIEEQT